MYFLTLESNFTLGSVFKHVQMQNSSKVKFVEEQSVTYRYREFFIFLVVSEPVSEQIGTGKSLGTGIAKI